MGVGGGLAVGYILSWRRRKISDNPNYSLMRPSHVDISQLSPARALLLHPFVYFKVGFPHVAAPLASTHTRIHSRSIMNQRRLSSLRVLLRLRMQKMPAR